MKILSSQIKGGDGYVMGGFTKESFARAWRETLRKDPDSCVWAEAELEKAGIPISVLNELVREQSDLSFVKPEEMAAIGQIAGLCLEMVFEIGDHMRK